MGGEKNFLKKWNDLYEKYKEKYPNSPKVEFTGTKSGSISLYYKTQSENAEQNMNVFINYIEEIGKTIDHCPFTNHKTESQVKKEMGDKKEEEIKEAKLRRKEEKEERQRKQAEQTKRDHDRLKKAKEDKAEEDRIKKVEDIKKKAEADSYNKLKKKLML